jgi:Lecithin retinol acyltransferase
MIAPSAESSVPPDPTHISSQLFQDDPMDGDASTNNITGIPRRGSATDDDSYASHLLEEVHVSSTNTHTLSIESQALTEHGVAGTGSPVSLIDTEENSYCMEVVPPEVLPGGGICSKKGKEPLRVGDHVYQWRSWMGIPGVFQHHGIVMDIQYQQSENHNAERTRSLDKLIIADFSNVEHRSKKAHTEKKTKRQGVLTQEGILRTYADTDQWHRVEYSAAWWQRTVYRAGTCTSVGSDAVGLVLARVNYILRNPEVLPDYHVVNANCECVAVWCKTGRWCTLQASSLLELTTAGQVKSTATLAATAASTQVTVQAPAAGVWGWLGYTTTSQVSWLSLHPVFVPALAGYAVLSIGVPATLYVRARKQWKAITESLKESFWQDAMAHPDVFAECMTHWSDK